MHGKIAICTGLLLFSAPCLAQESSLFHNPRLGPQPAPAPPTGRPSSLPQNQTATTQGMSPGTAASLAPTAASAAPVGPAANVGMYGSYYHLPKPPERILKVHDIIQIRVDEAARMTADGIASARKNGIYDAVLEDWIKLTGLALKPAPQPDGDPAITGQTNQTFRASSTLTTRESLVFNIAAEIIDVRPNGNVVLQARKRISVNDNRWVIALTGECQGMAVGPDNVVFSKDMINLEIEKGETGQARDGYRRGWFTEFVSRFQPF